MTTQQLSDAELAAQPAAYWTGAAYEALIAFIRARHAELGFTQPQFWLLRNLSKNDISPDGQGMTVPELQRAMSSYLRPEDDLEAEAKVLLERGWLTRDGDGRLWITEAGRRLASTSSSTPPRSANASTTASTTPTTSPP
ncbi:MarR family transcriptional regulator [Actinomadura yumaensis]|uniref:MarR family transcriptional regulator n=1 Tax=Actinomadura yumaensis TaxID=111807 RepID=UPI00361455DE